MKKYKLLQDYPLLPNTMKAGFEVEWNNPLNAYHHALTLDVFTKSEVEKYPKFWKLIEISDFQITSFRGVKGLCLEGKVYTIGADGKFSRHGMSLNCMLSEGNCVDSGVLEILSVRRNVDYIEFTLGDKIAPEPFVRGRKFTRIDKIYYNEHNQLSYSTNKGTAPCTFVFGQDTSHYKSPILITEDRVELFEGDYYYRVLPNFTVTRATIKGRFIYAYLGAKLFSTEGAALNHVIYHKKMLSVKDVFEAWKESKPDDLINLGFLENIKNLVDKRVKR